MTTRTKILLGILVVALAWGAFYLRALAHRVFRESAPRSEESARAKLDQIALQPKNGTIQLATLYFPSPNDAKVAPEGRSITWAQSDADRVRQVVLALAEGSRQGLGRVCSPSTTVRAVFMAPDGTAYLDLSSDFLTDFEPGIQSETLAIYAIVNSISTNIPAVKRVQFLIQGQQVETLDGHADLSTAYTPDPARNKSNP